MIYPVIPTNRFIGYSQEEQLDRAKTVVQSWGPGFQLQNIINDFVRKQTALFNIGKISGGYTSFLEKPEDAEKVYKVLFTVINNRYTLGYYPPNPNRDGSVRNLQIEVRDRPEYKIIGRRSYIALGAEQITPQ